MILSRTPVRIEIGGGATDVEPYSSDYGGYVINVSINQYFRSILNRRDDNIVNIFSNDKFSAYEFDIIRDYEKIDYSQDLIKAIIYYLKPNFGIDVYIHGEPPKKAGLGASASLTTSLIAGILKLESTIFNIDEIAEKAYHVEQNILKNEGGRQDQYASVYGGFNGMEFKGGSNVVVNKIKLSNSFKKVIEKSLILFYTGEPHISGDMVRKQVDSYLMKKEEAKKSLDKLKEIAYEIRDNLITEDLNTFGNLLTKDWIVKTEFNPFLTTDYMRELNKLVMKNGGIGGRVCGAGGGGCFLWLVNLKSKEKIISLLNNKDGKIIDFEFIERGLDISYI